jgi:hypothetical protein
MGILHTDRTTCKTERTVYEPLEAQYKGLFAAYANEPQPIKGTPRWAFGFFLITDYGTTFIEACTMKL